LVLLILFLTSFLSGAFACQRFLYTLLFVGLQVKGMSLASLYQIFLVHLALEA
jgi:hypothetical protein